MKKDPQRDTGLLRAAFEQGDWKIECSPGDGEPVKLIAITGHSIQQIEDVLVLTLELPVNTLQVRVYQVFNLDDAQFGRSYGEPRRFSVRTYGLNDGLTDEQRRAFVQEVDFSTPGFVFVRDKDAPPGWPDGEHVQTYGMEQHRIRYGNGEDLLRTPTVAQPRALRVGDILATGDRVLSPLRRGYNSSVLVHLGNDRGGAWISMAARLPIALRPR